MYKIHYRVDPLPAHMYLLRGNSLILGNRNKKYTLRVNELEEEKRPREKLIKHGPAVLSAAELLAVFLNVGTKKESILQMTSRILKEYGEKNIINQTDAKTIAEDLGIPLIKACQIVACFELGRRFFRKEAGGPVILRTANDVFDYLKDMRDLPKEQFRGLYLNSHYRLIHDEVISVGSLTANIIHPREVYRPAVEYSAAAVIVAHNHPSGNPEPTKSDVEVTQQLVKAGEIFGIDLLDHIIIGGDQYMSVPAHYASMDHAG